MLPCQLHHCVHAGRLAAPPHWHEKQGPAPPPNAHPPGPSWLCAAWCSSMRPTRPWPRMEPPPSAFTPTGPSHCLSWAPTGSCVHQGVRSMAAVPTGGMHGTTLHPQLHASVATAPPCLRPGASVATVPVPLPPCRTVQDFAHACSSCCSLSACWPAHEVDSTSPNSRPLRCAAWRSWAACR